MRPWRRLDAVRLERCTVFDLDRVRFEPPDRRAAREFYVVEAPDWINIIPLTDDRRVVLIRQFRFGVDGFTLEIPGGMCEANEPPIEAARREMIEESGCDAAEILPLGWVHPNPAIQNNRCHSFLALGARAVTPPRPDPDEAFEVSTVPLDEIAALIRAGTITHALVIAAFHLLSTSGRARVFSIDA